MPRISYTEHATNEEVLRRVITNRMIVTSQVSLDIRKLGGDRLPRRKESSRTVNGNIPVVPEQDEGKDTNRTDPHGNGKRCLV